MSCDNESALWNAFGNTPVATKMASFDIVKAKRRQIVISPLKCKHKWVKSHHDEKGEVLEK